MTGRKKKKCLVCGSILHRNKEGFLICKNGHQANIVDEVGEEGEGIGYSQRSAASTRAGKKDKTPKQRPRRGRRRGQLSIRAEIIQNLLLRQVDYLITTRKFPDQFEEILLDIWMLWVTAKKVTFSEQQVESDSEFNSRSEFETDDDIGHLSDFSVASTVWTMASQPDEEHEQAKTPKTPVQKKKKRGRPSQDHEWHLGDTYLSLALLHLAARATRLPVTLGQFYQWAANDELPFFEADPDIESLRGSSQYSMRTKAIDRLEQTEKEVEVLFEKHFDLTLPKDEPTVHVVRFMHALSLPAEFYMDIHHCLILLYGVNHGYDLVKLISICVILCKSRLESIQLKERIQKIPLAHLCLWDMNDIRTEDIERYTQFASKTISTSTKRFRRRDLNTLAQAISDHKRKLQDRNETDVPGATLTPKEQAQTFPIPPIPNKRSGTEIIPSYDTTDIDGYMDPFDFHLVLIASEITGIPFTKLDREIRRVEMDILKISQILP